MTVKLGDQHITASPLYLNIAAGEVVAQELVLVWRRRTFFYINFLSSAAAAAGRSPATPGEAADSSLSEAISYADHKPATLRGLSVTSPRVAPVL